MRSGQEKLNKYQISRNSALFRYFCLALKDRNNIQPECSHYNIFCHILYTSLYQYFLMFIFIHFIHFHQNLKKMISRLVDAPAQFFLTIGDLCTCTFCTRSVFLYMSYTFLLVTSMELECDPITFPTIVLEAVHVSSIITPAEPAHLEYGYQCMATHRTSSSRTSITLLSLTSEDICVTLSHLIPCFT